MFARIRKSHLLAAAILPLSMAVCGARAEIRSPFEPASPQNVPQQNEPTTNSPTGNTNAAADGMISEEQLRVLLDNMGYAPETCNLDNGHHYFVVKFDRSGWKFAMTVSISEDRQFIWLSTPVLEIPQGATVSPTALLKLMEQNYLNGPSYFSFRPSSSNRLYYSTPIPNHAVNAAVIRNNIDQLVAVLQATYPLWQEKTLLAGGTTPTGGTTTADSR